MTVKGHHAVSGNNTTQTLEHCADNGSQRLISGAHLCFEEVTTGKRTEISSDDDDDDEDNHHDGGDDVDASNDDMMIMIRVMMIIRNKSVP